MILPILEYGDPILRAKGKPIEDIEDRIRELAANMIETMHAANGVGLAAQQVGEALQLTVLDVSLVEDRPSTLKVDGKEVDNKKVPHTIPALMTIDETFDVGVDTRTGVDDKDYQPPFRFTGKLEKLTIKLGPNQMLAVDEKAKAEALANANN